MSSTLLPPTWKKERLLIVSPGTSNGRYFVTLPRSINGSVYEDWVGSTVSNILVTSDKFESENQTSYSGASYWRFLTQGLNSHYPALPDSPHPPTSYQNLNLYFSNPDGTPFTGAITLELEFWCVGKGITDKQLLWKDSRIHPTYQNEFAGVGGLER